MNPDLCEEGQGGGHLPFESRASLLNPFEGFVVAPGFAESVDNVQVGPLRIRRSRIMLDEELVKGDRSVGLFQTILRRGQQAQRISRARAGGKLLLHFLKILYRVVVLSFLKQSAADLIERVGYGIALWIVRHQGLIVIPGRGKFAIELIYGGAA